MHQTWAGAKAGMSATLVLSALTGCAGAHPAGSVAGGGRPLADAPVPTTPAPTTPPDVLPDGRIRAVDPPVDIPGAFARLSPSGGTVAGEKIYHLWIRDGGVEEREADRTTARTMVRLPRDSPITVELATARTPVRVDLLLFRGLSRSGAPKGVVGNVICDIVVPARPVADAERCVYSTTDRVTVRAGMPSSARVVVVNAGWYVPTAMREHDDDLPVEVSASWVFPLAPR
ncbi:hypothetical protein [Sinosporangium siamense]|uniref:Lipoprotein n=1 Tax=Sinosporangium siamense TaxID=1367973 RepID=A0A919RKS3_9ACTN|nr:hypothetical protein [Sinosporangium siamense]GII95632.1 hypothetical protein Ssi02_58630 [Sinosporangium siamense]